MQAITTESLLASVRSFVPGRLRLRHPALAELSDDLADGLVAWLKTKPGMTEVTLNPRVGSLLLLWDESQADWTFEDLAEEAAGLFALFAPADESVCGVDGECAEPTSEACENAGEVSSSGEKAESSTEDAGRCRACAYVKASVETLAETLEPAGEALKRCGQKALDLVAPIVVPEKKAKAGARTRRVAQNRLMGGALAGSSAAIFLRAWGAHWVLGSVFFGFLAVHLWQHRRVL